MNLFIVTCLAASLASAQQSSLRPEVLQAIGLYYQAKADLQSARADRDALPANATDEQKGKLDKAVEDATDRHDTMISSLTGKDQLSYSLAHLQHQRTVALVARQERADRNVALAFLTRLRNVQAGESAATGGTTALTTLANATQWISAAFESGALAKESKGTVTTIRVGGYGVYSWLYPHGQRSCAISNPYCDSSREMWLRGLSGSISIDNSSPDQVTTQPTQANFTPNPVLSFLGTGGRITSATARMQFLQRVTPATPTEIDEWRKHLKTVEEAASTLNKAVQAFANKVNTNSDSFQRWRKDVRNDAASLGQREFEERYLAGIEAFVAANPQVLDTLDQLHQTRTAFHQKLSKALSESLLQPAATVEYVYASPSGQQSTSGIRFVLDKKIFHAAAGGDASGDVAQDHNATITANASFNWYNDIPTGITSGRMRDAQVSAQLERAIGPATRKLRSSAALSAYYQYQINPAILTFDQNAVTPGPSQIPIPNPAAAALDSKGHIGIIQGKLTLRLTDSISIPLAVSWANRTELIKASTIKGQIGINIEFGSLLGK